MLSIEAISRVSSARRRRDIAPSSTSFVMFKLQIYEAPTRRRTEEHKKGSRPPTRLIRRPVMDAPLIPLRVEDAYFIAARTSFATSSMSSAFSAGNGRFMSSSSSTVLPPTVTTKAPLRGFSLFTSTVTPGKALASRFALVLNAPQLLQASTSTTAPPLDDLVALALAADGFLAGALALAFFAITLLSMRFARVPAASETP